MAIARKRRAPLLRLILWNSSCSINFHAATGYPECVHRAG